MRRFLPVACLLAGVMSMATPMSAQTLVLPIAMGETVQGRLEASDPLLTDGSRYDLYLYRGQAGELLQLTLRSADFDGYLSGGRIEGASFVSEATDDDGAGGTDAQLSITVGASGTYAIQVKSYEAGETGAYTLTLEKGTPAAPMVVLPITIDETVNGRLVETDPKIPDGSHYHMYMFRGRPGQRVVILMRSEEFDAYLYGGRIEASGFVEEITDDDSGGDTDARLEVTIPESGQYVIRVNSLEAAKTGAYTLTVQNP
jgi:hypothetical protein